MITVDPHFDYSEPSLLRRVVSENAELRDLCAGVAQELERMACERPELAPRLLARAMRIRERLNRSHGP